jgi:hypothetical protein
MFILDLKLQLGEEPLSLGDPQPFPKYVSENLKSQDKQTKERMSQFFEYTFFIK